MNESSFEDTVKEEYGTSSIKVEMMNSTKKLLLMGSKAFGNRELPVAVKERIDTAITQGLLVIVGEAPGANRAYQDYLKSKDYRNVIVGHALSIRYNAGNWETRQYGKNVRERENGMIQDCDEAIIIWVNHSSVIANNLERLKLQGKPTFIYEYSTETNSSSAGMLDPSQIYDPNYYRYKYFKKKKPP